MNVLGQNARDSGYSIWKKMCQVLFTTSTSSNVCLADGLSQMTQGIQVLYLEKPGIGLT